MRESASGFPSSRKADLARPRFFKQTGGNAAGTAPRHRESGGVFETLHYQKANPAVVLLDVDMIAATPTRYLVAGMGDVLATWFETLSCSRTQSVNECGGRSTNAGLHIAKLCYETLLAYGSAARIAAERRIVTPALEHIVEANILLSGLGFESAGLAAAHAIYNSLTALAGTHSFYHGGKVAFGVLAELQLTDASMDES